LPYERGVLTGLAFLVFIGGVVGVFAVPSVTIDPCRVRDGVLPGCPFLPITESHIWLRVTLVVGAAVLAGVLLLLARRSSRPTREDDHRRGLPA
jgi:hypothetical protein